MLHDKEKMFNVDQTEANIQMIGEMLANMKDDSLRTEIIRLKLHNYRFS